MHRLARRQPSRAICRQAPDGAASRNSVEIGKRSFKSAATFPKRFANFGNERKKLTKDLVAFLSDLGTNHQVTPGAHLNPAMKPHIDQWMSVVKAKHLSPHDAAMADQNLLSYLKTTCQFDVTATQSHLTYDYFQRLLTEQQNERNEISSSFTKIIEILGH
jgi:hypothetical protein